MTGVFGLLLAYVMLIGAWAFSIRMALGEPLLSTRGNWIDIVAHPLWLFAVGIFLALLLGQFGRGEESAVPWVAFAEETRDHGSARGIFSFLQTLLADLWLFWIPGQLLLRRIDTDDATVKVSVRLLNVGMGLFLATPHNLFS